MSDRRHTVILADDHPMLLEGLYRLLEPTLEILATATDGQGLVDAARRLQPDLVIADLEMPGLDGIEATRQLGSLSPATRVMILSFHGEPSWVRAAFEAGARGYLTKASAPEEIDQAVLEVLGGRFFVSPRVAAALVLPIRERTEPEAAETTLTQREQEVIRLVGRGLPNKEIANDLGISVTTVRTHLRRVYGKLGRGSRVELALFAARNDIVEA
jgi:DNA-binding NarL/FixJ family response regulator